ncbi:hypothetical protein CWE09_05875 [Aliidiomarina minuta]|uniref:Uncharacterized protein n=1 Tax=Aliidiomarina minuta TaxID=880057 RepID=A0A432W807_9GAMM|nr:hypothetical protein [Aliidiomarina minuta]RUO26243.1 hypothetical protein CWE09_05875 [Aliidiomarina minuta]
MKTSLSLVSIVAALTLAGCSPVDEDTATAPVKDPEPNDHHRSDRTAEQIAEGGTFDQAEEIRREQEDYGHLPDEIAYYVRQDAADNEDQCEIIAVGHSPCGGPESYVVFSTRDISDDELRQLRDNVERFNRAEQDRQADEETAGTCEVAVEPQARFRDGRCVPHSEKRTVMDGEDQID